MMPTAELQTLQTLSLVCKDHVGFLVLSRTPDAYFYVQHLKWQVGLGERAIE